MRIRMTADVRNRLVPILLVPRMGFICLIVISNESFQGLMPPSKIPTEKGPHFLKFKFYFPTGIVIESWHIYHSKSLIKSTVQPNIGFTQNVQICEFMYSMSWNAYSIYAFTCKSSVSILHWGVNSLHTCTVLQVLHVCTVLYWTIILCR